MSSRVFILATHPVQYHAPFYRELVRQGMDIEVLYCFAADAREQAAAGFGVEFAWDVDLLGGYPHRFLRNAARNPSLQGFRGLDTPDIGAILAAERPRAVIVYGWHFLAAWQTVLACLRLGIPYFLRGDSQFANRRPFYLRAAKYPVYSLLIRNAAGCLPVGARAAAYFRHYGARPERVHIVPHCVDDSRFLAASGVSELRAAWGVPVDSCLFLFCGKFLARKRPLDFLLALRETREKSGSGVAGVLVGDGPLRTDCESYIAANKLPVHVAGFVNQSELPRVYSASDCLVLPSDDSETWGLVVNEAMLCGVPAIVSDTVGCLPELIEQGGVGSSFPVGDWSMLAARMQAVAEASSQLRAFWRSQSRRVAMRSSVNASAAAFISALSEVPNE